MKIAICSFLPEYSDIVKYGSKSRKSYCKKYNYDYIEEPFDKITIINEYISQYDFILWMDPESYIMNDTITLESLIKKYFQGDLKDVMYTSGNIRGIFFVRNTEFVREYFKKLNRAELTEEIDPFENKVIVVHDQKEFNSCWNNYSWGDFIIHFKDCPIDCLKRMMNMFCPLKMENDTDDTFKFRINWLTNRAESDLYRFRGKGSVPLFQNIQPEYLLVDIMMLLIP
jgi:hypothetical protein